MRQLRPAASSRSMMVGTQGTGEGTNGPEPSGLGMQEGTDIIVPEGETQSAFLLLSHPHVSGPSWTPSDSAGLSPVNPSVCAAARSRWLPQLGWAPVSKVRSEITKDRARAARLGIWLGSYCA